MCGIAGVIDLVARRSVPTETIGAMAQAIVHRGPDEDGFLARPGLALANRRLSIVGLLDGRQPIANEDQSVWVVYNGELFDYPERRAELEGRGHRFRTHCDTEIIPHLWEEYQEGLFERLRGQFAIALYDERRQRLVLARDRFGICPLHWTRQGDWLLFGSEIKAILASGMVKARPDRRGLNHLFTFYAFPGPRTCFEGIQALLPGHYLSIQFGQAGEPARVSEHTYWEIDFPDAGQEDPGGDTKTLVDSFERVLMGAVERRLRADVPVVSYLSGGVDSSMVVAMATKVLGRPIPTFTIQIDDPRLDETEGAGQTARHVGANPAVVKFGADEVLGYYPELIRAAESPVIDTSCAALLLLARRVHKDGYKVALTGEGSDEWMAGYPWYKVHKLLNWADAVPGLPLGRLLRRLAIRWAGGSATAWDEQRAVEEEIGPRNAWFDFYSLMSLSKRRFYSQAMHEAVAGHNPYLDIAPNLDRLRRWHPLNQGLYFGARIQLPGLLLNAKGDRVAMNSSVETRYPFLDEEVFAFLAKLSPRWKLRGFRDKHILRLLAERWLPASIARRSKVIFRAPFDSFHLEQAPPFVEQLLSEESLRHTGYFDAQAVHHWRKAFRSLKDGGLARIMVEMGLVGVIATQLWHQTYIEEIVSSDLLVGNDKTTGNGQRAVSRNGSALAAAHRPLPTAGR